MHWKKFNKLTKKQQTEYCQDIIDNFPPGKLCMITGKHDSIYIVHRHFKQKEKVKHTFKTRTKLKSGKVVTTTKKIMNKFDETQIQCILRLNMLEPAKKFRKTTVQTYEIEQFDITKLAHIHMCIQEFINKFTNDCKES